MQELLLPDDALGSLQRDVSEFDDRRDDGEMEGECLGWKSDGLL